jgi:uncharacterized protein YaiL (DUF2058 family)
MREQIASGRLAIVKLGKRYEVVNADIAEKLKVRNAACVVVLNKPDSNRVEQNDPYAGYEIPDDLMW